MPTPIDPRDSGRWRKLRAQLRCSATHCARCHVVLDHHNPRSKASPTIDHIKPLADYPHLAFDTSNLRVICLSCNASLGATFGNQTRARRVGTAYPNRRRRQPPRPVDGGPGPGW